MPDLVLALEPVRCPKSNHVLFELFMPGASGMIRKHCTCGRILLIRLHEGQVQITVQGDIE